MSDQLISQNVISIFKVEKQTEENTLKKDTKIFVFFDNGVIQEMNILNKDITLVEFYKTIHHVSIQTTSSGKVSFWMTEEEYNLKFIYIFYDQPKQKWIYDTKKDISIKTFSEFFSTAP